MPLVYFEVLSLAEPPPWTNPHGAAQSVNLNPPNNMNKRMLKSLLGLMLGLALFAPLQASFYYQNNTGNTVNVHWREDVNYYSEVFTGYDGSYVNNDYFTLLNGQSLQKNDYTDNNGWMVYEHFFSIDWIEEL